MFKIGDIVRCRFNHIHTIIKEGQDAGKYLIKGYCIVSTGSGLIKYDWVQNPFDNLKLDCILEICFYG